MQTCTCVCVCAHLGCNQALDRFAQSFQLCTSLPSQRSHMTHTDTQKKAPHTHPLNTQHHPVVPKSAGVFPHGASKRQRLRDQRLLWLCASARLLSALMQICARQSGSERQAGRHACSVWVTIDPPTIHICVKLHSRSSSLYGYQLFCLFLTFSILHHSPPLCMQH